MALTPTPVSGPILWTPDPSQTQTTVQGFLNPNTGLVVFQVSTDGGKTYRTLLSDPGPGPAAGSLPTLGVDRNVGWARPASAAPSPAASAAASVSSASLYVDLVQTGSLYAGQTFGYFQVPATKALVCTGVQLSLLTAAVGASATVCLVTAPQNVETVQNASLASGVAYGQSLFSTPLPMAAGTGWQARVKGVGSTTAGECLSVRLLLSVPS